MKENIANENLVEITVELPAWLSALAEENHIDLSELLEEELKKIINQT